MKLTDAEVLNRLYLSEQWMRRFRMSDQTASNRYIDANLANTALDDDWSYNSDMYSEEIDVPDNTPVGQPNYWAINNETKIAAIAMARPTLYVKANEDEQMGGVPQAGEIVQRVWEKAWDTGDWGRETQAGLQKLGICGLTAIWYRWDERWGVCFENVYSRDLLLDPNARSLSRMEFGGVKVRMTLRKAEERYPNGDFGAENDIQPDGEGRDGMHLDKSIRTVSIYFDEDEEIHVYQKQILYRGPNLYKKVPLLFMGRFIDPRGRMVPLGDNTFCAGLNQQVVDLANIMSNMAKHGGQITLMDTTYFDASAQEAIKNGVQQQVIPTSEPINPQTVPIMRISAENPSNAWMQARQEAQQALDGMQGATPAMRGEAIPRVTATASMIAEQRGGSRVQQDRYEYERLLNRMASVFVDLMQMFGGPEEGKPSTAETELIWRAFKAVYDVRVVEGSSGYDNPAQNLQQWMQLFTTTGQMYELLMAQAQQGLIQTLPNMMALYEGMLRAAQVAEMEKYTTPAPEPQQQDDGSQDAILRAWQSLYKTAPPDVRRQIEQQTGLQPSQLGDAPEEDGGEEAGKLAMEHNHDIEMESMKQGHDTQMQMMKMSHERQMKVADIGSQARMAEVQAKQQKAAASKKNGK